MHSSKPQITCGATEQLVIQRVRGKAVTGGNINFSHLSGLIQQESLKCKFPVLCGVVPCLYTHVK